MSRTSVANIRSRTPHVRKRLFRLRREKFHVSCCALSQSLATALLSTTAVADEVAAADALPKNTIMLLAAQAAAAFVRTRIDRCMHCQPFKYDVPETACFWTRTTLTRSSNPRSELLMQMTARSVNG